MVAVGRDRILPIRHDEVVDSRSDRKPKVIIERAGVAKQVQRIKPYEVRLAHFHRRADAAAAAIVALAVLS